MCSESRGCCFSKLRPGPAQGPLRREGVLRVEVQVRCEEGGFIACHRGGGSCSSRWSRTSLQRRGRSARGSREACRWYQRCQNTGATRTAANRPCAPLCLMAPYIRLPLLRVRRCGLRCVLVDTHTHSRHHLEQTLLPQPSHSIPNKHVRSHMYTHASNACTRTRAKFLQKFTSMVATRLGAHQKGSVTPGGWGNFWSCSAME